MPEWRKLHTKARESIDINDMPDDFTRLLWIMLPLALDKEGRGHDNPSWIRAMVMPMRLDVTIEMVSAAVDWYAERGMIQRYEVEDRRYFLVPSWHLYQSCERESESRIPAPPTQKLVKSKSRPTQESVKSQSRPTHDLVSTNSPLDKRRIDIDKSRGENINAGKPRDYHFEALAIVCKMNPPGNDWSKMPKTTATQVGRYSAELKRILAEADLVSHFDEYWYLMDWRGQKGQCPKPADVVNGWTQYMNWIHDGKPQPNGKSVGSETPMQAAIRLSREKELANGNA